MTSYIEIVSDKSVFHESVLFCLNYEGASTRKIINVIHCLCVKPGEVFWSCFSAGAVNQSCFQSVKEMKNIKRNLVQRNLLPTKVYILYYFYWRKVSRV